MKTNLLFFVGALALASCTSDELIDSSIESNETPIAFSVEQQNITRATNLEAVNHYNFGVWAYKYKSETDSALVMSNYLVGYSDDSIKGYDHSAASTWAAEAGSTSDHIAPWFYEGLGTSQYTLTTSTGYYLASDTAYMSANANQYLRYWDLAYTYTNFYAYAPYNKAVTFDASTRTMSFGATVIRDGYDNTLNTAYANYDRSLSEFMYAGVQATNANLADVTVPFKHMGAQVGIRFYEDIPNYRVEIIDLDGDNGTVASTFTKNDYNTKGIQAAPASKNGDTYLTATYYTTNGATVTYAYDATPTYAFSTDGSTTSSTPLMFKVPTTNLESYNNHRVIPNAVSSGTQTYSESPTVYYAVAQPTTSTTGFTFHLSYRIIAEDNQEQITVHNATVFVPASTTTTSGTTEYIAAWQPNTKYTYSFKITTSSSGTTTPDTEIDPTDPTASTVDALYPIVFDGATIEDYTVAESTSEL